MINLSVLLKITIILLLLPISLFSQLQPVSQWLYHNLSCQYKSGLADQRNLAGDPTNGVTVFLSTESITCSNSDFQSRGSWTDATREIGGAWIIIEFPSKEICDYDRGEFWGIMSYWVTGPGYGYESGYIGSAGLTEIDTLEGRTVSGWLEFNDYNGSTASGSFTIPLCLTSTNSIPPDQISNTIYQFKLYHNYPNPFNPFTSIEFSLPRSEFVQLEIYNALGQKIKTLVNESVPAGFHRVNFDAPALPGGFYFYKISAGEFVAVKKMILIR